MTSASPLPPLPAPSDSALVVESTRIEVDRCLSGGYSRVSVYTNGRLTSLEVGAYSYAPVRLRELADTLDAEMTHADH